MAQFSAVEQAELIAEDAGGLLSHDADKAVQIGGQGFLGQAADQIDIKGYLGRAQPSQPFLEALRLPGAVDGAGRGLVGALQADIHNGTALQTLGQLFADLMGVDFNRNHGARIARLQTSQHRTQFAQAGGIAVAEDGIKNVEIARALGCHPGGLFSQAGY